MEYFSQPLTLYNIPLPLSECAACAISIEKRKKYGGRGSGVEQGGGREESVCRAKIGKMYAESTPVVDSEYTERETRSR